MDAISPLFTRVYVSVRYPWQHGKTSEKTGEIYLVLDIAQSPALGRGQSPGVDMGGYSDLVLLSWADSDDNTSRPKATKESTQCPTVKSQTSPA